MSEQRRVIIYTRTSRPWASGEVVLIADCRKYAAEHNLKVVEEIVDTGKAGTLDRIGLTLAFKLLAAGKAEAILVHSAVDISGGWTQTTLLLAFARWLERVGGSVLFRDPEDARRYQELIAVAGSS